MVNAMRALALVLVASSRIAAAECPDEEAAAAPHDELVLTKVKFAEVPGWTDDKVAEAVPAFLASCQKLAELKDDDPVGVDGHGGKAKQWRAACAAAAKLKPGD